MLGPGTRRGCGCGHHSGPAAGCDVTTPGSIIMADRNLGLAPGASYTQEWAIYPTSDACPDYYCFINAGKTPSSLRPACRVVT